MMWLEYEAIVTNDDLDEFTYELMLALCGEAAMEFEARPLIIEDRILAALEKSERLNGNRLPSPVASLSSRPAEVALLFDLNPIDTHTTGWDGFLECLFPCL